MKLIATKISALLVLFALSSPGFACEPSNGVVNRSADIDTLSHEDVMRIKMQFDESL